jgi:hypothetical protein
MSNLEYQYQLIVSSRATMRLALSDNVRALRPRTTLIDEQRSNIAQQAIVVEPSNGLNQQHCTSLISNGFAAASQQSCSQLTDLVQVINFNCVTVIRPFKLAHQTGLVASTPRPQPCGNAMAISLGGDECQGHAWATSWPY